MDDDAPALTPDQIDQFQALLKDVARLTTKASLTLNQQTLLVQDVAYIRALGLACQQVVDLAEGVGNTQTLIRYAARPDEAADDLYAQRLVDLAQFRAPTDLRGLLP